jgi:thymidylate kinase
MLITVSGAVGSGKSTAVAHVIRCFEDAGHRATMWHFRSLPCFTWWHTLDTRSEQAGSGSRELPRRLGYRRKLLTGRVAFAIAARAVAFRLFRRWRGAGAVCVCNRYFYDNLAHYELRARSERGYVWVLSRIIPTPDLAILMVASVETIRSRRPQYANEYLVSTSESYRALQERFPELVTVSSDVGDSARCQLEAILKTSISDRPGVPAIAAR